MAAAAGSARPSPQRPWLRPPKRTLRLRLTLVYSGLFLLSGVCLLALTNALAAATLSLPARGKLEPGQVPGAVPKGFNASLRAQLIEQRANALHQLLMGSGIALAVVTVLSAGLGWLVAGRVLRPLRMITAAAQRCSASKLHERLMLTGPEDELKELGDTFDALLERLGAAFEAQRQFVANASHELRTPLARQRTLIEVALRDQGRTQASLEAAFGRVLPAIWQQERMIDALLTLARSHRGLSEREPIELALITSGVIASREPEAKSRQIHVHAALQPASTLGDARLMEQLVTNLVDNALRYNVPDGWIQIVTGIRDGYSILSVANTGAVIPESKVKSLFEPFQRLGTDRISGRGGLGLGLSIVNAIVNAHDAQLNAGALPGGGLEIIICFRSSPYGEGSGYGVLAGMSE
jgi:signal transduction histidine kinase